VLVTLRICIAFCLFAVNSICLASSISIRDRHDFFENALQDLHSLLLTENLWVKVHVAEFLLRENQLVQEVRNEFLKENRKFNTMAQYRIGIWRVLAQVALTEEERTGWVSRIVRAYEDAEGPDRLHAIETLAKLRHPVITDVLDLSQTVQRSLDAFALYSLWNAVYRQNQQVDEIREFLFDVIDSCLAAGDEKLLPVLSFIVRNVGPIGQEHWKRIREIALSYRGAYHIQASLLTTAWISASPDVDSSELVPLKRKLQSIKAEDGVLINLLLVLSEPTNEADYEMLKKIYEEVRNKDRVEYDADTHATAAYAVLKAYALISHT